VENIFNCKTGTVQAAKQRDEETYYIDIWPQSLYWADL
jgi:hypothetical protein